MVAQVDVVNCWPMVRGDARAAQCEYQRGQFAWILENARRVPNHPVTGQLRLYDCDLPPDVAKLLDDK